MVNSFENVTEQLLSLSPDLILLDLNLPCVSGFQICREIKQKSAIPVLVLTSRDQMKDELHALKLGADEYLTKPCRKNACLPGWQMFSNVMKAVPIFWRAPISPGPSDIHAVYS